MRKSLLKRVSAAVCAVALTIAMTTSCFAADRWTGYFGQNMGWYEGAIGELTAQSEDSWTANLELIGWGGVWGAQVKDEALKLKKGTKYELAFDLVSDTVDKWVFVKVANDNDDIIYGEWIQLKKGKKTSFKKEFTPAEAATKIVFGIGGEFGDRTDEADMYELTSTLPDDVDANYATKITCTNFSLEEAGAKEVVNEKEDSKGEKNDKEADVEDANEDQSADTDGTQETSSAVQTGDSTPVACATIAVIAAAAIVVFTRKREEA